MLSIFWLTYSENRLEIGQKFSCSFGIMAKNTKNIGISEIVTSFFQKPNLSVNKSQNFLSEIIFSFESMIYSKLLTLFIYFLRKH